MPRRAPGPRPPRGGAAGLRAAGVPTGVRRPGGAAEEGPGVGRRRPERQAPGRLHRRGDQHGREAGRGRPRRQRVSRVPETPGPLGRREGGLAPFWDTDPRMERGAPEKQD